MTLPEDLSGVAAIRTLARGGKPKNTSKIARPVSRDGDPHRAGRKIAGMNRPMVTLLQDHLTPNQRGRRGRVIKPGRLTGSWRVKRNAVAPERVSGVRLPVAPLDPLRSIKPVASRGFTDQGTCREPLGPSGRKNDRPGNCAPYRSGSQLSGRIRDCKIDSLPAGSTPRRSTSPRSARHPRLHRGGRDAGHLTTAFLEDLPASPLTPWRAGRWTGPD